MPFAPQRLVQAGRPEHALARLVDDDLAGDGRQAVDDLVARLAATRSRPMAPVSPMLEAGLAAPDLRRRAVGEVGLVRLAGVDRPASPAGGTARSAPATVGTMASSRATSLPRLSPKPPGSMKSRCMSMTTSAGVPGRADRGRDGPGTGNVIASAPPCAGRSCCGRCRSIGRDVVDRAAATSRPRGRPVRGSRRGPR